MSRTESIATPTWPTSPALRASSLSSPICVGRSKATESPGCPCASRYRKRAFASVAVPKPAYWRMLQRRPRYIVGWMPRVNGGRPGSPSSRSASCPARSSAVYSGATGMPLPVSKSSFRSVCAINAAYTLPAMALPVTPLLVTDFAAALAVDGWRYTQRQLYYATCARAETPASNAASNGEIGLGVLMILVGLILIGIKVAFVLFVSLGVALAAHRRRRTDATARCSPDACSHCPSTSSPRGSVT